MVVVRVRVRRTVLVVVAVVLAVVVAGFAVVLAGSGTGRDAAVSSTEPAQASPGSSRAGGVASDAVGGAAAPEAASSGPGVPAQVPPPDVPIDGVQKALVRTAQITVEVTETTAAARQVRTLAAAAGGQVAEEQSSNTGAWLVVRVPADKLDRLIEDVGAVGTAVTARSSQVTDATEQVVDLDARVASQQASVARVRALLAQATSIGDVVAVESELSRREADLDSLTSRLAYLRDQVALSTLTVDLRGPATPPAEADPPLGFLAGLAAGWDGLRALGAGVAAVVGFVLPFVPVLGLLAGIVWLVRRIVRGRRAPAAAPAAAGGGGAEGES